MPDSDLFIATEEEAQAGGDNVPPGAYFREPEPGDECLSVGTFSYLELASLWLILQGIPLSTSYYGEMEDHFPLVYEGAKMARGFGLSRQIYNNG